MCVLFFHREFINYSKIDEIIFKEKKPISDNVEWVINILPLHLS